MNLKESIFGDNKIYISVDHEIYFIVYYTIVNFTINGKENKNIEFMITGDVPDDLKKYGSISITSADIPDVSEDQEEDVIGNIISGYFIKELQGRDYIDMIRGSSIKEITTFEKK